MTLNDLKQIRPIQGFDCVKMKHDIQAKIHEETRDMTWEERVAYRNRKVESFHRRLAQEAKTETLAVKEKPPKKYGK